ncbi:hypothetical protein M406DRAFT_67825 [Cryphonectria parasitica EP155]|uniref:Uncharacterized protein n=1 Tax=Cryphonectria parasitica (strain ATCC 38755 / EP155) TaxID=660469 RepID=A0A9P4Y2Q8_CRYP1|nr:uncharacterized protein M406DRAFT_67825 [Cryphonectria parasitica EP155]KAF3765370.1 hypothetical protein M406DRAFT_67825 [Cryphonectria parasitica EP155]
MTAFWSTKHTIGPMSLGHLLTYGLLLLHLSPGASAGNTCSSLNCFSATDNTDAPGAPVIQQDQYASITCPNKDAPTTKEGWGVYKSASLPTVEVIEADLRLCGIVTAPDSTMLFYSFGAGSPAARAFATKYPDLKAKNINDVMPESWFQALTKFPELTEQAKGSGQQAWVARSSQALAKAASGEVYLLAKTPTNIYTLPYDTNDKDWGWRGPHNVWSDYEFATLQANPDVTAIYTVTPIYPPDAEDTDPPTDFQIDKTGAGSWVRSRNPQGGNAAYNVNANTVTKDSIDKLKADWKPTNPALCKKGITSSTDAADACLLGTSTSVTSSTSTSAPTTLSTSTISSVSSAKATTTTSQAQTTTTSQAKPTTTSQVKTTTTSAKAKTTCAKGKKSLSNEAGKNRQGCWEKMGRLDENATCLYIICVFDKTTWCLARGVKVETAMGSAGIPRRTGVLGSKFTG